MDRLEYEDYAHQFFLVYRNYINFVQIYWHSDKKRSHHEAELTFRIMSMWKSCCFFFSPLKLLLYNWRKLVGNLCIAVQYSEILLHMFLIDHSLWYGAILLWFIQLSLFVQKYYVCTTLVHLHKILWFVQLEFICIKYDLYNFMQKKDKNYSTVLFFLVSLSSYLDFMHMIGFSNHLLFLACLSVVQFTQFSIHIGW